MDAPLLKSNPLVKLLTWSDLIAGDTARRHSFLIVLFALHAAMLTWSATRQAPTVDEPVHLAAGIRVLTEHKFDLGRGNPFLAKIIPAIPAVVSGASVDYRAAPNSFEVANDFLSANGSRSFHLITIGRLAMIPISLIGIWLVYSWAAQQYGYRSGLLAACLWCFNPFLIGNGELITGDMTLTVTILAACLSFGRWLREPLWKKALLSGLTLGLAALAKHTAVVLFGLFPVICLIWCANEMVRPLRYLRERVVGLGIIFLMATILINCAYWADGTLAPVKQYEIGRTITRGIAGRDGLPDEGLAGLVGALPVPLPRDYVLGVDEIRTVSAGGIPIYYEGEWHTKVPSGYYVYGLLMKSPIGLLALLVGSTVCSFLSFGRGWQKWRETLYLPCCGLSIYLFVTNASSVAYLRYVLPVLPFVIVWSSRFLQDGVRQSLWRNVFALVSVLAAAGATVAVYPHCGSYFNSIFGGTPNGYRHYIDSSYDWGQDLLYLREWLNRHDEVTELKLAYFGRIDPRYAGIEFDLPATQVSRWTDAAPYEDGGPEPGWYAISISLVQGFPWDSVPNGRGGYERFLLGEMSYFDDFQEVDRAGQTIFIYHLKEDEVNRMRRKRGLAPLVNPSEPHRVVENPDQAFKGGLGASEGTNSTAN